MPWNGYLCSVKHLITFILSVVLLTACGESERTDRLLRQAYAIADTKPDSALVMLKSICRDSLPNDELKYYHDLLTIKAKDKAYITHSSDSSILSVIAYYEKHPNDSLLPVAYYYGGRVYADLGDAPQALEYFQKALDCENGLKRNKLKGKITSQMGQLYNKTWLFRQALEKFKMAIDYNFNDSLALMYNYNNLASSYKWLNKPDSALYFMEKALKIAEQNRKNHEYEMLIHCQIAAFYSQQKKYNQAKVELEKCLPNLKLQKNKEYAYSIACDIYTNLCNYDLALYYANMLLDSDSLNRVAHGVYIKIAKNSTDRKSLFHHFDCYLASVDSQNASISEKAMVYQNAVYNYRLKDRENDKLIKQQTSFKLTIYLITRFCIILIYSVVLFMHRNKSLKMKLSMQISIVKQIRKELSERQVSSINNEIFKSKQSISELKKALTELFNEILDSPKSSLGIHDEIIFSNIYSKFRKLYNENKFPMESDWQELEKLINDLYANFSQYLRLLKHDLSLHQYHVCLLTKCGFSQIEIAVLTNHSTHSIYSCKKRLCKSFFSIDTTSSNFDTFISSI